MIVNAQMIKNAKQSLNQAKQLQLDLKCSNIREIGNLAATLNYFECIDLSNNLIYSINDLTYLDRLKTLILGNNRIEIICDLGEWLPNLQNLSLMDNRIKKIEQAKKLGGCRKLQNLVLFNNPICERHEYRKYVVGCVASLKILDFKAVQKHERGQVKKANRMK